MYLICICRTYYIPLYFNLYAVIVVALSTTQGTLCYNIRHIAEQTIAIIHVEMQSHGYEFNTLAHFPSICNAVNVAASFPK